MENKPSRFIRNEKNIAHISILVIFLGLIRCICEFYRLEYTLQDKLNVTILKPFIAGALIAAIGIFIMVILYFFSKYKFILAVGILTITFMLIIKKIYLVN